MQKITCVLLQEGNHKPRLLNEHHWSRLPISDADNVGETIGLIEAEDPDGDQLWWTITAGNLNNTFAIRFTLTLFSHCRISESLQEMRIAFVDHC